jgi:putative MATE family efflux protein
MRAMPTVLDETKPLWRTMLVFLIPLMLSNVLQSAQGTAASIFLGRMIGTQALAAVSAFFPMQFLLIAFFIGISSGSTVLIGQAFGAGNSERIREIAGTTLTVALGLGIGLGLLGALFAEPMLRLTGTPADIFPVTVVYAKIIFIALPIFFVYLAYTTFMRGVGDSATPFYFLILSTVLGVVFTPAFIKGWFGLPAFGVTGSAVASTLATIVGLIGLLVVLQRRNDVLKFDVAMIRHLRVRWSILRAVIKIGLPTGVQTIIVSLAEIAVIGFVNRFGSSATAAYGAVNQVVSYVSFPALSIGIASSIFGAQAIGAKRNDRLPAIVRSGVALNYIVAGGLIAIVYLFSWAILGAFVTDPKTLAVAHDLLMITLWSYVLFGNNTVLSGVMRASGTVIQPTLISVTATLLVEVPVAYVLSTHTALGLRGVWIAYPVAFACALIAQTCFYKFIWTHEKIEAIKV